MGQVDWSTIFAVIAAFSAMVSAVAAWLGTKYAAETLRAQTEPKVIVYVKHDKDRPTLLLLVIENIGHEIAHNVKFAPARTLPAGAWGLPGDEIAPAQAMLTGPIVTGIPALGPGDSRVINWGQWAGLNTALGGRAIEIEFSYEARNRKVRDRTLLEVESYAYTDASDSPAVASVKHLGQIAQNTASIARSLSASGNRRPSQSTTD